MDTPFPFPWAQAVNLVIFIFTFTLPFVVVAHTTGIAAAACITFATVQTHVMLNEVCGFKAGVDEGLSLICSAGVQCI
jgi:predicted membrane chloride channel (bestrophin family)